MDLDLLNYHSLNKSDKRTNVGQAFEIAERGVGIAKLLDVEDIVDVVRVSSPASLFQCLY